MRARRELYRADQRADRTQLDPRRRLPPRGRRRLHGGGRRPVARPRRGRDRVARTGPVECDGVAAFGLSRRDADGDAGRPGRARRFRPACLAGAELFAAAVGCHETGHRGQRAGTGFRGDRPRVSPCRERHAGAGRGDPARGYFRRGNRRRNRHPAPACRRRAARRGSGVARRDAGQGRAAAGAGRRRADGRCGARQGGARRSEPARRGMGPADQPDASPAAAVRRDAPELRRLYGHPRAARADRRDEEGRSDGRARRAHDRYGQPVLHIFRKRRRRSCRSSMSGPIANEVGRVWRPNLGIPASPHEVIKGSVEARGAARRREAQGLGGGSQRDPQQSCWRRNGSRPATASISPRSSARSTSIWRRTRR